jgi:hypothetical protein
MDRCENDLEMQADFLRSYCKNSLNSDEGIRPAFSQMLEGQQFYIYVLTVHAGTFFCDG